MQTVIIVSTIGKKWAFGNIKIAIDNLAGQGLTTATYTQIQKRLKKHNVVVFDNLTWEELPIVKGARVAKAKEKVQ